MTAYRSGLASGSGLYMIANTAGRAGGVQPASSRGPSNGYPASEPSLITGHPREARVVVLGFADRLDGDDGTGGQPRGGNGLVELPGRRIDRLVAAARR